MKVKTAVLPVAGKGTRFLPATKEVPKEILPILNVPMLHYVIQEAHNAGIERIVFITSSGKEVIENFYDRNFGLEEFLKAAGKNELYEVVKEYGSLIEFTSIRQKEQLGLGHAILCAKDVIQEDHFAVLLPDDLAIGEVPVIKQLIDVSSENDGASVIGVMEVPKEQTNKYGIVAGEFLSGSEKTLRMNDMIEKPDPANAPTNLATPGRYVLPKKIFEILESIPRGAGGEYQLTDAIKELTKTDKVLAHIFEGKRYDTGSLQGYLQATLEFALKRDDLKDFAKELILEKAKELNA